MSDFQKRCFLHIGTEKTGTTTLQAFLDLNREALRGQGILFTESAGKQNNRSLSIAAFDLQRRDDATMVHRLRTNADLEDFQRNIVDGVRREVEESSCTTAIFSSEHFHSRLARPSEIARLKQVVQDLGYTVVTVVVYLRRPADLAASLFSTAVRTGNPLQQPPDPSNHYWSLICHHQNTLTKWGDVFGRENVVPRLFIRDEMVGGHIVDDFLHVVGLPKGSMQVPEDKNEALSALGLEILKRLNTTIPTVVDGRPNPLRRNLVPYVERYFSTPKYQMSAQLVRQYDEAFAESDEWVRANFFPAREKLFSYGVKESRDGNAPMLTPDTLQSMLGMLSDIWIDKHRNILHLQKKLNEK